MKKNVPPELRRAIRFKKRKKIFENVRISIATVIAAFFAASISVQFEAWFIK